ncbi:MAG: glycine--tRNA ligase subunit beta [Rugosibacter sp.]|nr:MAG: glycine--tRNA ligase subunit beta [Rugosibacter sp.]TBR08664.1 MAG: glycine--tRNA ligase subunit beta [Rugosibacter sp.]
MKATLLIELLCEELPPKSLKMLGEKFGEEILNELIRYQLKLRVPKIEIFATPRRLAVLVPDVFSQAEDRHEKKKLMPVKVALDVNGQPTPALLKKLETEGIPASEIGKFKKELDGKTEMFFYDALVKGATLDNCLTEILAAALKKLPVAKLMRWGNSEVQFVRPVHGLVLLHGTRVVPGSALSLSSSNTTRGHRFMSTGEITLTNADDYAATLEQQGRVIVSFDKRREMVRQQLDAAAGSRTWLQDDALLDEVTALVEYPAVYEAGFEAEFLAVPQECLILTMKANQKYFPLMDGTGPNAKLTNRFLVVSNMKVADPTHIITGNARVVRPRLADAKFFFEMDKKTPLSARIGKLASVVYHNKLGTQGERVDRLIKLAARIAHRLGADATLAERAALLAKADLVTDMVGEFPELQGIMGRYYALADGEAAVVAVAIEEHYRPRFNGDVLPHGPVACAVALADKMDALIGFFGIGQIPTGDKDPFGLRRAALGVLRILMETPLPLSLADLIEDAAEGFSPALLTSECRITSADFFRERLRNLLRDAGHEPNAVDAVLAQNPTRMDEVPQRLAAVKAFAALPEAAALAAANKRIVNILKKSTGQASQTVNSALLHETAEKNLFAEVKRLTPLIEAQLAKSDYTTALKSLADLRPAVDAFFEGVMVNADDPAMRTNRLALLVQLAKLMNCVADISRLSS